MPRLNLPLVMGMFSEAPISVDLMWPGMSSVPKCISVMSMI